MADPGVTRVAVYIDLDNSSPATRRPARAHDVPGEKALGYRSFSDFVKSRDAVAELDETNPVRLVRLHPGR